MTALHEAHRVLCSAGVLLAAAISRYMALLDWAASGLLTEAISQKLEPVIATGHHDSSLGFTDAYFHTLEELAQEVMAADFESVQVLGIGFRLDRSRRRQR